MEPCFVCSSPELNFSATNWIEVQQGAASRWWSGSGQEGEGEEEEETLHNFGITSSASASASTDS